MSTLPTEKGTVHIYANQSKVKKVILRPRDLRLLFKIKRSRQETCSESQFYESQKF